MNAEKTNMGLKRATEAEKSRDVGKKVGDKTHEGLE